MTNIEMTELIRHEVCLPALYEQLAEEYVELAHASLKMARILRGENPTPAKFTAVNEKLREELSDVKTAVRVVGLYGDKHIEAEKLRRWAERVERHEV